jgi:hypothetical protein
MEPMRPGETFGMGRRKVRVLVLAARQPGFSELLEHAGFDVEVRTRPLSGSEQIAADVAVVFRGRLIGRNQAPALIERAIPVIEVLTAEPQSASTAEWIRLSNRIAKPDLAQIVRAVADWTQMRGRSTEVAA